ncbi:hypothetical protein ACFWQ6_21280 [Streptomyces coelicoflavus]|uniref:hypothetical protein n=1 Tax=Streptomyces coelicoflavus TaxID=285562 RepID=UPI00365E0D62
MTPEQRRTKARAAAYARWAREDDPSGATSAAREAFLKRFEDQVDPERRLAPHERARRAQAARKAYFQALALKSSMTRRAA